MSLSWWYHRGMSIINDLYRAQLTRVAIGFLLCAFVAASMSAAPFDSALPVENEADVKVRIAAYNVMYGARATPEQIGKMLAPYNLDIIGFNEVPTGDWTARVGRVLGMTHVYLGQISSANHKDKYKSILSRTPLRDTKEFEINAAGWNPASAVRAVTTIKGVSIAVYSLHISGQSKAEGSAAQFLADRILPQETIENVLAVGDYNNQINDEPFGALHRAGLRSAWQVIPAPNGATTLPQGERVIDHICFNEASNANVEATGIIKSTPLLSDHHAVWAQVSYEQSK